MTHGSLFSGIGGFDLAAEWMGWENIFHCEIAEFPRKILKYHFPNSICYEDIKKTDFTKHRGEIDIISGGFPCQPYSNAGKRRGKEDDRHLWPEMLRVIREVQPRFVVGENVAGLLSWNNGMVFHEIITDLENEGYETQAFLIPACATNAPHRRDRIWFVAHTDIKRHTSYGKSKSIEGNWSGNNGEQKERSEQTERINGLDGLSRITAHTDGSRINRKKKYEYGNKNSRDWEQSNNTNNNGKVWRTTPDTDGTEQGNDIGEKRQIRRGKEGDVFGELCSDGIITDTESQRAWEQSPENRGGENRRFDNDGEEGNVADTMHERLQRQRRTIRELEGQIGFISTNTRVIKSRTWENFPTQSPICSGDDGISTELDSITFPKWRNESIKGYGNAVVPQVVYQIFKAIEQSIL